MRSIELTTAVTVACVAYVVATAACDLSIPKGLEVTCHADDECPAAEKCAGRLAFCVPAEKFGTLCGDGATGGDEECDDGNDVDADACTNACKLARCGDGIVGPGETCDDGNTKGGDGCSADCKKIEVCGDAIVDVGEQCDDGNDNPADGCDRCARVAWRARALNAAIGGALPSTFATLAVDVEGRVYFAEVRGARVSRLDVDGRIEIVAGTGSARCPNQSVCPVSGDGSLATSVALDTVNDVAVDGLGRLFIAEDRAVREVDVDGTIHTLFALDSTPGGPTVDRSLSAIAVDGLGRVLFANSLRDPGPPGGPEGGSVVERIGADGSVTVVAGGGNDATTSPIAATAARLDSDNPGFGSPAHLGLGGILDIAVANAAGAFYVADPSGSLLSVDENGLLTRLVTPTVTGGFLDGIANVAVDVAGRAIVTRASSIDAVTLDGSETPLVPNLSKPFLVGVAVDGTIDFVQGGNGSPIELERFAGGVVSPVSSSSSSPSSSVRADALANIAIIGVAVDSLGGIVFGLFANDGSYSVRRFDEHTGAIDVLLEGLPNLAGIALDTEDRVLVATFQSVLRREPDGSTTTIAGSGANAVAVTPDGHVYVGGGQSLVRVAPNGAVSNFPSTPTFFGDVRSLAIDAQGDVFVGDDGLQNVRKIDVDGVVTTVASIANPSALVVDPEGRLLVADGGVVVRLDTDGTFSLIAGSVAPEGGDGAVATTAFLGGPTGLAFDHAGRLLIAVETDAVVGQGGPGFIRRVDESGVLRTIVGPFDVDGVGPLSSTTLSSPTALAIAPPSLLLVAGGSARRLFAVDETGAGGDVRTVAGDYPVGPIATPGLARFQPGFGSVGGVAFDAASRTVYVTETDENRVDAIGIVDDNDASTWTIARVAGSSTGAAGARDGDAAFALLRGPTGLAFDPATSALFVADTGNHDVRRIDLAHAQVTTTAGRGVLGFFGDGGPATSALLFGPTAVAIGADGALYIADSGNDRVRKVDGAGVITTILGDGTTSSSGEGAPSRIFPVDKPAGLAVDARGNLYVTSSTTLRLLPARDDGVIDGAGPVLTVYGAAPRDAFPASATQCLSGVVVDGDARVEIVDACAGLLVAVDRVPRQCDVDADCARLQPGTTATCLEGACVGDGFEGEGEGEGAQGGEGEGEGARAGEGEGEGEGDTFGPHAVDVDLAFDVSDAVSLHVVKADTQGRYCVDVPGAQLGPLASSCAPATLDCDVDTCSLSALPSTITWDAENNALAGGNPVLIPSDGDELARVHGIVSGTYLVAASGASTSVSVTIREDQQRVVLDDTGAIGPAWLELALVHVDSDGRVCTEDLLSGGGGCP